MIFDTLLQSIRNVLGTPNFYVHLPGQSGTLYSWDYGAMLEYAIAGIILCICISSVFKLIRRLMFG